jgi:mRNA interferase MazF
MPSTTNYQKGDFVLIAFPFSGGAQMKVRPAMVVLDTGDDDVLVARVTTQRQSTPYDVRLAQWQASGLLAASLVRLHKLATLEKRLIRRILGQLQSADRTNVAASLQQVFGNW